MVSNGSGSWYNAPARPFPAKVWLVTRYSFRVSPAVFARYGRSAEGAAPARRAFPALVWLAAQQRGTGRMKR
jgi:hypothetical protein